MLKSFVRALIYGSSDSGKSSLIGNFIENKEEIFEIVPTSIFYCTNDPLSIPKKIKNQVIFVQGLPSDSIVENSGNNPILIVVDDLMEAFHSQKIASLYTKGRHRQIHTITLCQNLFCRGPNARNISLNCNYIFLMYSLRDKSCVNFLGRQLTPSKPKLLSQIYEKYIDQPYKYLCISLNLSDDKILMYRSDLLNPLGVEVYLTSDDVNQLNNEKIPTSSSSCEVSIFTKCD